MSTVLILGANSDIAKALAYRYAENGFDLILASREVDRLDPLSRDIGIKYDVSVSTVCFDALAYDTHQSFYGGLRAKPLVVICAFGYLGDQSLAEKEFDEAKAIIETNYVGGISILNVIANEFERRQEGVIIGISSVAGDRGRRCHYIYGSAKAGFSTYLAGLRNRLSNSGVRVITVKPGFVKTKMTRGLKLPMAVTATPRQVASDVYNAVRYGRDIVYTRWYWRWIMAIIKAIPERWFKRLSI